MPLSPHDISEHMHVPLAGCVRWGHRIAHQGPGVYMLSASEDPRCGAGTLDAPIAPGAVDAWRARVPSLLLDDARPTSDALRAFLASCWVPGEAVVYVGKATNLSERTAQFFCHVLGNRRPHAGGHWIKTLSIMHDLFLHVAICPSPADAARMEIAALDLFISRVPSAVRATLGNSELPLPFANRVHPVLGRKQSRLRGDVLP